MRVEEECNTLTKITTQTDRGNFVLYLQCTCVLDCNDYMILIIDFHALCVCVCVISLVKLDKEIETV